MADTGVVVLENPHLFPRAPKHHLEEYVHQQNLKKGIERLDRRSLNSNKGAVKKHGHGGKYTIDGPYHVGDYNRPIPAAMDENDPNFIDPIEEDYYTQPSGEETTDKEADIPKVEVVKVETTGAGKNLLS